MIDSYFTEHGFTPALAAFYGVRTSGSWLHYRCFDTLGRFERSRDLSASRKATRQPKGRKLAVCYLHTPPASAVELLLCEGEPDALAAQQARHTPPYLQPASRVLKLVIAFLPGTATPTRKIVEEVARLRPSRLYVGFDHDHAGDAAIERLCAERRRLPETRRLRLPAANDLAEHMAALGGGNRADALLDLCDEGMRL